jgi:uncharacterized coiled-coil protein SlyX
MADAKPADSARAAEGSPRVVPLGTRAQPGRPEPARDGVSWNTFGIAAALLVFALAALLVQTQHVSNQADRISALDGQVAGLEAQLSAANAQLAGYDRKLGLIRAHVATVVDQVTALSSLVAAPPAVPPALAAPAPPPAAD